MAGRFARSLDLARAAWSVVRSDKELMLLAVLSVAALLLILGSLAVPVALLGGLSPEAVSGEPGAVPALGMLVFYIVAYFVTLFFNRALVGAAVASSVTRASPPRSDCCCARSSSVSAWSAGSSSS